MTEKEAIALIAATNKPYALKGMRSVDEVPLEETIQILASDQPSRIVGSVQDRCGCGRTVWLAPSTQAEIAKRGRDKVTLWCPDCMAATLKPGREQ